MRILIVGINYTPELIGIGPYTTQFAEHMAAAGHDVTVVAGKPYYPEWSVHPGFSGSGYRRSVQRGINVWRCPIYVPHHPNGLRRILHHISFAISALLPLAREMMMRRPDMIFTVAPSLMTAPVVRWAGRLTKAKTWLHVQDFEVEAAFATGLMPSGGRLSSLARRFERWAMSGFSHYSSISPQMCAKLEEITRSGEQAVEFRNWTDIDEITPATRPSRYRADWNIATPHVALYSGNLSNKQGIGLLGEVAQILGDRDDLTFVICGEGSGKAAFIEATRHLSNVQVHPLQPRERLQDLLGLATIHLLPQIEGAADLVLPSKLTNILASGRPVVATADHGTGLANEVEGCGIVTKPGRARSFADAIETLIDDPDLHEKLGRDARRRAEERWAKDNILGRVERALTRCLSDGVVGSGDSAKLGSGHDVRQVSRENSRVTSHIAQP